MGSHVRWLMRRHRVIISLAVVLVCVMAGIAYALSNSSTSAPKAVTADAAVTVTHSAVAKVQPGFLGLSLEIRGVSAYTGTDPHAENPVFEQLIRNLDPGQRPVLRLGGDSTDWVWYPYRKGPHPLGVRTTLTASYLGVIRALAQALDAHLIMGVNLEQDSARVAAAEAQAFLSKIGRQYLQYLALGNEPELYHGIAWFSLNGHKYYGRPAGWDFPVYLADYSSIVKSLPSDVPLAGPDVGSLPWIADVGSFLSHEPRVKVATIHRYPLLQCSAKAHVTIPELLSDASTRGFVTPLEGAVRAAHKRGVAIRLDETNSVSCGGAVGVSNTFSTALWALDEMFEVARAGFDGVNVHTREVPNQLFIFSDSHGHWKGTVEPDYYGLLAFAQAAPAGSQLLRTSGAGTGPLHVWATSSNGTTRVVLINMSAHDKENVSVHVAGASVTGTVERLGAPGLAATGHVSLGGQSFGSETTSGMLSGNAQTSSVTPTGDDYTVSVPAASAAILTLPAS